MRALLDTSVLIGQDPPADVEAAISVASITELHFGVLLTDDPDERARRADRLAVIESTFDPLPITVEGVPLPTHNLADFEIIGDLVDVRHP